MLCSPQSHDEGVPLQDDASKLPSPSADAGLSSQCAEAEEPNLALPLHPGVLHLPGACTQGRTHEEAPCIVHDGDATASTLLHQPGRLLLPSGPVPLPRAGDLKGAIRREEQSFDRPIPPAPRSLPQACTGEHGIEAGFESRET